MKNDQIRNLIIHLDDDDPFLIELRRRFFRHQKSLSTADRLVHPLGDPAFGIHFVRAYHRAGACLPNQIFSPSLWSAFCCLRYDQERRAQNDDCFEALALAHPANRVMQARIKGLLCGGLNYEEVGKRCGKSRNVIQLYSHLFFDFLERQDDDSFVTKVLNPRLDLSIINADKTRALDPVLLVMRIGYCLGPEAVVKVLGLTDERDGYGQPGQQATNIKNTLLSVGEIKAKLGLLAINDPEFVLAKTLLAEEAKKQPDMLDDDFRMGLGRLSMSQGAQLVLKKLLMTDAEECLEAQQEYDAGMALEEVKRKAAGGGGPAGGTNGKATT
jgi:hypothetical protein